MTDVGLGYRPGVKWLQPMLEQSIKQSLKEVQVGIFGGWPTLCQIDQVNGGIVAKWSLNPLSCARCENSKVLRGGTGKLTANVATSSAADGQMASETVKGQLRRKRCDEGQRQDETSFQGFHFWPGRHKSIKDPRCQKQKKKKHGRRLKGEGKQVHTWDGSCARPPEVGGNERIGWNDGGEKGEQEAATRSPNWGKSCLELLQLQRQQQQQKPKLLLVSSLQRELCSFRGHWLDIFGCSSGNSSNNSLFFSAAQSHRRVADVATGFTCQRFSLVSQRRNRRQSAQCPVAECREQQSANVRHGNGERRCILIGIVGWTAVDHLRVESYLLMTSYLGRPVARWTVSPGDFWRLAHAKQSAADQWLDTPETSRRPSDCVGGGGAKAMVASLPAWLPGAAASASLVFTCTTIQRTRTKEIAALWAVESLNYGRWPGTISRSEQ